MTTSNTSQVAMFQYVVKGEAANKGEERPVIGTLPVAIPTLAAFGIEAAFKTNDAGEVETDAGVPVYADAKLTYLQKAIQNACMVKVRTFLQKNSIDVKPGKKLPESLEEYLASDSDRGAARREKGEAIRLFGEWVTSKGKPQKVVEYLTGALANADSFKTQPEDKRNMVASAVIKFMEESIETLTSFQQTYLSDTAEVIVKGENVDIEDLDF